MGPGVAAMTRRGLTLLETLLALSLMGVLAMAGVSWTTTTLGMRADTLAARSRERDLSLLERTLRADLVQHDASLPARFRREERLWIHDRALHILTRDAGPARVVYAFRDGALTRTVEPVGAASGADPHVLLSALTSASFELRFEDEAAWATLTVRLEHEGSGPTRLNITFPEHWAR